MASVILNTFARNCPASAAFPPSNYLHPCTWLKSSTYYAAVPPFLIPYDSYPVHLLPKVALSKKSPYVPTSHRVSGLMLANNTSIRCGAQAHIHTNMYTHTYTHIHIHTPKYTYTHSYSHTHTHTHMQLPAHHHTGLVLPFPFAHPICCRTAVLAPNLLKICPTCPLPRQPHWS